MTPYSFAFTIIRLLAVLMLSIGAWSPIGLYLAKKLASGGDFPSDLSFELMQSLTTFLPGLALYLLAHWLAKAVVWKIGA